MDISASLIESRALGTVASELMDAALEELEATRTELTSPIKFEGSTKRVRDWPDGTEMPSYAQLTHRRDTASKKAKINIPIHVTALWPRVVLVDLARTGISRKKFFD